MWIDRSELRVEPEHDLVAAQSKHRGGRLRLEGHECPDVVELRAEVVDHLLRGLGRAARTVQDEVQLALLDAVATLHERMHIVSLHVQGRVAYSRLR